MINNNSNCSDLENPNKEIKNYEYYPNIYTLLYNNLACLTQMHYNNQFLMIEEINKLKKQNEILESKLIIETNKRKLLEDDETDKLILKIPRFNKYAIKTYRPHQKSYSDYQIYELFFNI